MKKRITLLFCIVLFAGIANASTFFVDPTNGVNTNDGLSWATAVKTIDAATTLAAANPGTDDIYIKGSNTITYAGSSFTVPASVNFYGGFQGIDGETAATRPLSDIDGNGITESWEFQYPTTIYSTNPNTALNLAAGIFDGFTITHVGTKTTGLISTVIGISGATFQNNTIKNSVLTVTITGSSAYDGLLIRAIGTFKNCLIEKNTVNAIGATTTDKYLAGIMNITAGSSVSGCVIRNNKANLDYSGSLAGPSTTIKGVIVNLYGGASGLSTYLTDCLIYNNEVLYAGGGGTATTTLTTGSIVGTSGISSNYSSNYIVNCTIANNKLTNTANGGIFLYNNGTLVNYCENNAIWNNQVGGIVKNLTINSNVTTGRIGYNIMNKGNNGGFTSNAYTANNSFDMTLANVSSPDSITAPRFKLPTTNIGVNRVSGSSDSIAIAHADWRMYANSYLVGKGMTTSVLKDKAGNDFSLTTPSVGAYEFAKFTPVISWNQNLTGFVTNNDPLTIALTATTSADVINGSAISYTSSDETVVAISGSNLVIQGKVGTATITAHQASNTNYNAATDVSKSCSIAYGVYTNVNSALNQKLFSVTQNGLLSNTEGNLQIISFSGKMLQNPKVTVGQFIALEQGAYILRMTTNNRVFTQKVVL